MLTLFAIGTLWFWLLVAAASIFIIWALEDNDEYPGTMSTVVCAVTLGVLYFLGSKNEITSLFEFIRDNPLVTLAAFGIYIFAGSVWSIVKWYFYVLNAHDKYKDKVDEITKDRDNTISEMQSRIVNVENGKNKPKNPDEEIKLYQGRIKSAEEKCITDIKYAKERCKPNAKENKSRILTWMFYWPFSGVWTMINDPVRRIFQRIYTGLEKVYQKITDNAFADE